MASVTATTPGSGTPTDDQATPTQQFGIFEEDISDYNTITNNDVSGNTVAGFAVTGVHTVVQNNTFFKFPVPFPIP